MLAGVRIEHGFIIRPGMKILRRLLRLLDGARSDSWQMETDL